MSLKFHIEKTTNQPQKQNTTPKPTTRPITQPPPTPAPAYQDPHSVPGELLHCHCVIANRLL